MTERRDSSLSGNGRRGRRRDLARDLAFTLLFAVIAAVSAVALAKTVTRPFQTGSYGVAQWALFAVTVVGSTLAFLRSIRFYASWSLLARARPARSGSATDSDATTAPPQRRMHPRLDDLSWAAIALAVALINALAVWAVLVTLEALFGDSTTPTGWLAWQLALLTAASTTLLRFAGAVVAELRDRSRRRRRNLVHIVTGKLVSWPGEAQHAPSDGAWKRRAAAAVAAAALAAASWTSASGPLLDPASERAGEPDGGGQRGPGAAPHAGSDRAARRAGASGTRGRERRARRPSRAAPDSGDAPPAVAPAPPTPPQLSPPPVTVAPTQPPAAAPPRKRSDGRARKRRRREREDRAPRRPPPPTPTPAPAPMPTVPAPTPIPPPTTTPVPTVPTPEPEPPCDPGGLPSEPPCDPSPPMPPPPSG